ncbi:DNA-primase RepB domain-containing protein [Rhodovastum atsumiense]|uniref:RepB-like DNA primase domain-containing protein n=1 Tax=Rhodovastum atsumiense TaxID=504468 RepID=A0A5M6IL66_9PROT|nr:DNA-primase RepB domain-containing protein [Rhodovastum atsumiense]KAA5608609.1 hypothetical protein F1189_28225 [Rhodovastum atsumiense]
MPSERYDIRAVWPDRAAKIPSAMRTVSGDGLLALIGFLKAENAHGFNIIGRPVDPCYIFVDDISDATLRAMVSAGHRPAVIVESSPANYQGFFDAGAGIDHLEAKLLARHMAERWGGDPGSADAWHAGRLPGFTNRKVRHRRPDGSYPFARLRTASARIDPILAAMATELPLANSAEQKDQQGARGGALRNCAPAGALSGDYSALYGRLIAPYAAHYGSNLDRSRADYAIARRLLADGMPPPEVSLVLAASEKAREHGDPWHYIERTVSAAKSALGRERGAG